MTAEETKRMERVINAMTKGQSEQLRIHQQSCLAEHLTPMHEAIADLGGDVKTLSADVQALTQASHDQKVEAQQRARMYKYFTAAVALCAALLGILATILVIVDKL